MGGTFQYLNPGTIHWGEGSLSGLDAELSRSGARRVFLITTGSVERNPALRSAVESAVGTRLAGKTARIGQHAPVGEVAQAARELKDAKADARRFRTQIFGAWLLARKMRAIEEQHTRARPRE